ncbi:hypothetical protein [Nocardia sp. NPDC050710]|uniref:hypothetical protein n=1 Tax=Nocardia sp. NPDC050710 TaxID=3157220 RepID=UPI0033F4540A
MRHSTGLVELVTAFISAVIGGLALTTPIMLAWAHGTSTLQIQMLATSMPRSTAIGCVAAVVVAVFASTAESMVVPWASALCGAVVLLLNQLVGRSFSEMAPLTTLNYIDSLAGGMLLGGLVAAAAVRPPLTLAFVLGALTSIVVGDMSVSSSEAGEPIRYSPVVWFVVDSPPLWLIWPATALLGWFTVRNRAGRRYSMFTVELPLRPILAAVVGMSVPVLSSEWLVQHGNAGGDVLLVAAVTVAAAFVTALLLPGHDGILLLMCVALAAVGAAIALVPGELWHIPVLMAVNVVGLWLGLRRPSPMIGMIALVALGVFTALAAGPHTSVPGAAGTATLMLVVLTGYCFTSAMPSHSPSLMLSIATLVVPGVVVAMRGRVFSTDPKLDLDNAVPGGAAVLITLGCMGGLLLLRRRAVEPDPAPLQGPPSE